MSVESSRLGQLDKMQYESHSSSTTDKSRPSSLIMTYEMYYGCALLWNVCLIAFYTVQVFSSHEGCYTKTSKNITDRFEFAFQAGFAVHVGDFLNTNLVGIYLRARMADEEKRFGYSKDSTYGLMMVSAYAEWVFRISIIAVSCL